MEIIKVEGDEQILLVEKLAKEIWMEHYKSILSEKQIDYMLFKYQTYDAISGSIREAGYEYYLLVEDKTACGYMAIRPKDGRLFLSKLYIHKDYRGKGYSKRVFDFLTGYCRMKELSAIWLTCNKKNSGSLRVYEKAGFKRVDDVVADIGMGYVMDDYVLEKII